MNNSKIIYSHFFILSAAALSSLLTSCAPKNQDQATVDSTKAPTVASADHGKYLVTTIGCNDCHTPWAMGPQGPAPDMSKMLSGHPASAKITAPFATANPWMVAATGTMTAWSGPWGVSFAMNLTPDSLTGIGSWSQQTFMNAIRTGKHMGTGRPILPPMPWQGFKEMTDDDLGSIYMYLRTIPAISNQVPSPIMPPGGMPPGMGGPPPGQTAPPPAK
jgi:mono/diheme cytochrome c family protein